MDKKKAPLEQWDFFWVVDPPLFDYNEEEKRWEAAHHAFTRPRDGDLPFLETDPAKCAAGATTSS